MHTLTVLRRAANENTHINTGRHAHTRKVGERAGRKRMQGAFSLTHTHTHTHTNTRTHTHGSFPS